MGNLSRKTYLGWEQTFLGFKHGMQVHCTAVTGSFLMSVSGNLSMTPHNKIILSLLGTTASSGFFHYPLCTYAVTIHNLPLNLCFNPLFRQLG